MVKGTPVDPRFVPFKDYAYTTFYQARGVHLVLGPSNLGPLKQMLTKTQAMPEYSLANLEAAWLVFLDSPKRFDREVSNPLRHFVTSVEYFVGQVLARERRNGNSANVDAARAFVQRRLRDTGH